MKLVNVGIFVSVAYGTGRIFQEKKKYCGLCASYFFFFFVTTLLFCRYSFFLCLTTISLVDSSFLPNEIFMGHIHNFIIFRG